MADAIAAGLGVHLEPERVGQYRAGDIRHCYADVSLGERLLGFRARVDLEQGMADLIEWVEGQQAVDRVDEATGELVARGLAR
jgi:dTDP-L-rhamnose 4-epimerase